MIRAPDPEQLKLPHVLATTPYAIRRGLRSPHGHPWAHIAPQQYDLQVLPGTFGFVQRKPGDLLQDVWDACDERVVLECPKVRQRSNRVPGKMIVQIFGWIPPLLAFNKQRFSDVIDVADGSARTRDPA